MSKTQARRAELRTRLIELATQQIATGGLTAVKARPLAEGAGCSLGAIYTIFADLHDLILAVNGETFAALGAHVASAFTPDEPPEDQLVTMAQAYLSFAETHPKLWRALFEIEMSEGMELPDWYVAAVDQLFALIDQPLIELYPELGTDEIRVRTQTLFSAIHGIVLLGVEQRLSAVNPDDLPRMIRYLLHSVVT